MSKMLNSRGRCEGDGVSLYLLDALDYSVAGKWIGRNSLPPVSTCLVTRYPARLLHDDGQELRVSLFFAHIGRLDRANARVADL